VHLGGQHIVKPAACGHVDYKPNAGVTVSRAEVLCVNSTVDLCFDVELGVQGFRFEDD